MKVTIKPVKGHPNYKFRATYSQGGIYKQSYFKTKVEAKNFAEAKTVELENVGISERGVSPDEFRALLSARKLGKTLKAEHITDEFSFSAAVEFYAAFLRQTKSSVTVKHAVAKFLDWKERKKQSAVHLRNLTSRANAFEAVHGKRIMATLTKDDVESYLASIAGTARTQINHRLVLSNLFNFAVEKKWLAVNPASSVEIEVEEKPPGILSPDHVSQFLQCADVRIVPAYAVAFFGGLREAEIARLDWKDIKLERDIIDLSASKTKTGQRRLVAITPNLKAWLEPHRQQSGLVRPSDQVFRKCREAACLAAGIEAWPHNAARHCFGSYHYAAFQNAAKTASELGHSDTTLLFKNYREIVTQGEGETYFQIMPEHETPTNIIRMAKAA